MNKEELMKMAREAKFEVGGSFIVMDAVGLADFACAILERAAVVAENEPKTWGKDAPTPQVRAAAAIRALKL